MTNPVLPVHSPRSSVNRNPGNLRPRHAPPPWPMQISVDTAPGGPFAQFSRPADGWCALGLWLLFAHDCMGLKTTRAKIKVFAPPGGNNDTNSYAAQVEAKVGADADPHNPAVRRALAVAIAHVEAFDAIWADSDIARGMDLSERAWPDFVAAYHGAALPPGSVSAQPAAAEPAEISDADVLNDAELRRIKGKPT